MARTETMHASRGAEVQAGAAAGVLRWRLASQSAA